MSWSWIELGLLASTPAVLFLLSGIAFHLYLRIRFLTTVVRVFGERPLFISPRGKPIPTAEDVSFPACDGRQMRGCYLRHTATQRRGVILFGLEFGSNRWACFAYCEHLLEAGYDVFAFEPRGQAESDPLPGYEPLQWVTDFEVEDTHAALTYLCGRGDADPRGIGLFGISKGGGAGLLAAVGDPRVRCFATDGIFGTYTTMVGYMRKWIAIYSSRFVIQRVVPIWYYSFYARIALRRASRDRRCRFPSLEKAIARLGSRPLFMIHGGGDTYIKPEMAERLFALAVGPKQIWMVDGAKHNMALHLAGDEYKRRILEFFNEHLADQSAPPPPAPAEQASAEPAPVELAKTS